MRTTPVHQDRNNPVCEGSGVIPFQEWGLATTIAGLHTLVPCPGCGHPFSLTMYGRIRAHRRPV